MHSKALKFGLWLLILLEIAVFILVGKLIGILTTLLLIVLTTFAGMFIIRQQNFDIMQKMQMGLNTGKPHILDLMDNSMIVLAGVLLIIPGFLTDLLGIICLIPKLRTRLLALLIASKMFRTNPLNNEQKIIEGEFEQESKT